MPPHLGIDLHLQAPVVSGSAVILSTEHGWKQHRQIQKFCGRAGTSHYLLSRGSRWSYLGKLVKLVDIFDVINDDELAAAVKLVDVLDSWISGSVVLP